MPTTLPRRADVPVEETMDLTNIYPSDAAWVAAAQAVEAAVPGLDRFRGRLGESPAVLLEALQARDALVLAAGRLGLYARLQVSADNGDQAALGRVDQAGSLNSRVGAAAAYFQPEILALNPTQLAAWMDASPDLAVYRHYFATIERQRAHIATPDVERTAGRARRPDEFALPDLAGAGQRRPALRHDCRRPGWRSGRGAGEHCRVAAEWRPSGTAGCLGGVCRRLPER